MFLLQLFLDLLFDPAKKLVLEEVSWDLEVNPASTDLTVPPPLLSRELLAVVAGHYLLSPE